MSKETYSSPRWGVSHFRDLTGNDRTTLLFTPQKGTGAETKTHTTTMKAHTFTKPVKIKYVIYQVDTAQTGAGNNLALNLYVNTTSSAQLALTTEAALAICTSSELNVSVTAAQYIVMYGLSTTTASDANAAIGQITLVYEEEFTNV